MLLIIIFSIFITAPVSGREFNGSKKTVLLKPIKTLFSHQKHGKHFKEMNISCQDCHRFSVKTKVKGPLEKPIPQNFLKAEQRVCHQCHLGKIKLPRNNQCTLCHTEGVNILKPKTHNLSWNKKHGFFAEIDGDSCVKCHRQSDCSDCHTRRDAMNPKVHPGNWRYFHSVDARRDPSRCVICHQSPSFCSDCHRGKRR